MCHLTNVDKLVAM